MKVLGVVGPSDADRTRLVDRLADRLADRGAVATVRHLAGVPEVDPSDVDPLRHSDDDSPTAYGLADDGAWVATGDGSTLDDVLASLAPDHDYALVEGFADGDLPKVVLGERDHAGEALATAPDPDAVDLDAVVDSLAETEPFETLESLVAEVKRSEDADRAGAIATFTGRVRAKDGPDDPPTEYLEFEKYDGVADEKMAALAADLEEREGVVEVAMHHRTGVVERGEDIVFVVVLAGHRGEAFRTVEDGIDRLKEEVPLFKKEVTVEETFWVHDRA